MSVELNDAHERFEQMIQSKEINYLEDFINPHPSAFEINAKGQYVDMMNHLAFQLFLKGMEFGLENKNV